MAIPIDQQNIIKILGIEALPDERKIQIIEKITDLVEKRLLLRVFESLSPEDQETLKNLLDREDSSGVADFLGKNAPNLSDWAMEEVGKIKKELAGLVS